MTPYKQLIHGEPDKGDCWRTCIACLLFGVRPEEVPDFMDGESYQGGIRITRAWLKHRGKDLIFLRFDGRSTPEEIFTMMKGYNPGRLFILVGASPRESGVNHAVIADENGFLHDPHPDNTFLAGPTSPVETWDLAFVVGV